MCASGKGRQYRFKEQKELRSCIKLLLLLFLENSNYFWIYPLQIQLGTIFFDPQKRLFHTCTQDSSCCTVRCVDYSILISLNSGILYSLIYGTYALLPCFLPSPLPLSLLTFLSNGHPYILQFLFHRNDFSLRSLFSLVANFNNVRSFLSMHNPPGGSSTA